MFSRRNFQHPGRFGRFERGWLIFMGKAQATDHKVDDTPQKCSNFLTLPKSISNTNFPRRSARIFMKFSLNIRMKYMGLVFQGPFKSISIKSFGYIMRKSVDPSFIVKWLTENLNTCIINNKSIKRCYHTVSVDVTISLFMHHLVNFHQRKHT